MRESNEKGKQTETLRIGKHLIYLHIVHNSPGTSMYMRLDIRCIHRVDRGGSNSISSQSINVQYMYIHNSVSTHTVVLTESKAIVMTGSDQALFNSLMVTA